MLSILHVDDCRSDFELIETRLNRISKEIKIDWVSSGKQALEALEENNYDCILCDYQMPEMDGLELLLALRERGEDTPFIFLTGQGSEKVAAEALRAGADDYFTKDVSFAHYNRLLNSIRKHVQAKSLRDEGRKADETIRHLNFVLQAIRNVNQLITKEKDKARLLEGVCISLTATRGYRTAWIALLDQTGEFTAIAQSGFGEEFETLKAQIERKAIGECCRKALERPGIVIIEDPISECAGCPLHETLPDCLAMTTRLQWERKIYGLLSVNVPAGFIAHEEEQILFEEAAGDIAFALHKMEIEEQHKQAAQALKESEERYRLLVETMNDGLGKVDEDYVILFANRKFCEMLGYSRDEMTSRELTDFVHPEDIDQLEAQIEKRKRGEDVSYELAWLTKTGQRVETLVSPKGIFDQDDGCFRGSLVVITDITCRKQMERILEGERNLALELSRADSLEATLDTCLDAALRISGLDCGGIYLVDESTGAVDLVAHRGLPGRFIEQASHFSADSEQARIIRQGRPIYTRHRDLGVTLDEVKRLEGLNAIAVIPVPFEKQIVACLNIASHTLDGIPELARIGLESIASSIGASILHARRKEEMNRYRRDLDTLFNTVQDFLFVLDMEGNVIHVNSVALERLGYGESELVGQNIAKVHPESSRGEVALTVEAILSGETDTSRIPLRARDAALIPVETKVALGTWRGRDALIGISRDITERQQTEEALRRSEQFLQNVFDGIQDGISVLDKDLTVVRTNCWIERKYSEHMPLRGKKCFQVYQQRRTPCPWCPSITALETGVAHTEIVPYPSAENPSGWIELSAYPVKDSEGRVVGAVEHVKDITDRKRRDEDLLRVSEELRIVNKELEVFAYTVTHDLKASIRHIEGYAGILRADYSDLLDEEGQCLLEMLEGSSRRMQQLIDAILYLSRITGEELNTARLDLSAMAETIARGLMKSDPERNVEFSITKNLEAVGDEKLLRVILENLFENAWKFTRKEEAAKIDFGKTDIDGNDVFFVRDNGIGFRPARAGDLFLPFKRLHTDKDFEGAGIGLATVRRIIRRHNGRIWAEGEPGVGATFYFALR